MSYEIDTHYANINACVNVKHFCLEKKTIHENLHRQIKWVESVWEPWQSAKIVCMQSKIFFLGGIPQYGKQLD